MIAEPRLESIDLNRFTYSDGHVEPFHCYPVELGDVVHYVYVFHAQVQQYGKQGLCLRIPHSMSRAIGPDSRKYLAMVQLSTYDEEIEGAVHVFHKHFRSIGGYEVIPIPGQLLDLMDLRYWTVAVSLLDKSMLLQYDGFVYPTWIGYSDPFMVFNTLFI